MKKILIFFICHLIIVILITSNIFAQENPQTYLIHMTKYGFSPQKLVVVQGDTVKFVNDDVKSHWPKSLEFDSQKEIKPGDFWEYKTIDVGEFAFTDQLFPKREGLLVVDRISFTKPEEDNNQKSQVTQQESKSFFQKIINFFISIKNRILLQYS